MNAPRAVTFDYGQTLAEQDSELLAKRLGERGARVVPARVDASSDAAWRVYNAAKRDGYEGEDAWCRFMSALLTHAGATELGAFGGSVDAAARWLFSEQPKRNLWRRPLPGMFELVKKLKANGVPVGIVSNSEGRLIELVRELDHVDDFIVVADSGALGFEKPDRRIFDHAAAALGVDVASIVHIGDAWEADVEGAVRVGARAIWFSAHDGRPLPDGVRVASTAPGVSAILTDWGLLPARAC